MPSGLLPTLGTRKRGEIEREKRGQGLYTGYNHYAKTLMGRVYLKKGVVECRFTKKVPKRKEGNESQLKHIVEKENTL